MSEFLSKLFSSDFMPHGACYLWRPEIVWLHATSDTLIALSYYLIPIVLIYFVRKRTDLPFNWIFVMFGVFILACGTTHVMEVWTLWDPVYRLSGVIKAFTAVVSIATAVMLVKLIPQALALPSPTQLRTANLNLENEIKHRRRVEEALHHAHDELEAKVQERTAQLASANEELRKEIVERQTAQEALHTAQSELAHVTRVTSMGELMASIAHEVNQPLSAIVTNGSAAQRWLAGETPNLEEARTCDNPDYQAGKPRERADQGDPRVRQEISSAEEPSGNQRCHSRDADVSEPREYAEPRGAADRFGHRLAGADCGSSATATGAAESDDERHRSHEHDRKPVPATLDHVGATREPGRRAGRGAGQRHGNQSAESRAVVRDVLHHQSRRHGHGTRDRTLDRKGARRQAVGRAESGPRRDISIYDPDCR